MKAYISYNYPDCKYREKLDEILKSKNYYVNSHDNCRDFYEIQNEINNTDLFVVLVGLETYLNKFIDNEIHCALNKRKPIVALILENRKDSVKNYDEETSPKILEDNNDYIVWSQFASFHNNIDYLIEASFSNSNSYMPIQI